MSTQFTPQRHCPSSQEPRFTGNSGNTGNGLAGRGSQPLPVNIRSGNRWQHKLVSEYKNISPLSVLVITVASQKAVATEIPLRQRLEATYSGGVATVAAVAGVFEISRTCVCQRHSVEGTP